jgi:uncharacterized protein with ATP-grasp and redox domains
MTAECIYCTFNQVDRSYMNFEKDEAKRTVFLQQVCREIGAAQDGITAPALLEKILPLIAVAAGKEDLYEEEKHIYNQAVLDMEEEIQQHIDAAPDKLRRALQYAMTGNYIDFGMAAGVSRQKLHELIDAAGDIELGSDYDAFKKDLAHARSLVFLHDNCGEIVFDNMCIAKIKALYPAIKITSIVRGAPALNDVTLEDAKEVGLTEIVDVIGNGSAAPGTLLNRISAEAKALIDAADMIISKGMGNYETMEGCGLNVYYLLLCKCERFARKFGQKLFSSVFAREPRG